MSIDWSKYPSLPPAPQLPEWRDTPEHEAYWLEVCSIKTPADKKSGCLAGIILWLVLTAVSCFLFFQQYDFWNISAVAVITLMYAWIIWYIFFWIWAGVLKRKISKKYGFSMRKLNRPDLSKEIKEILMQRSDFNETDFRKYWQTEKQADIACQILETANCSWYLHKKMLYPNDPLLLLFYGRQWKWGKEKMITAPEEFFIDIEDDLKIYEEIWDSISTETIADLVYYSLSNMTN